VTAYSMRVVLQVCWWRPIKGSSIRPEASCKSKSQQASGKAQSHNSCDIARRRGKAAASQAAGAASKGQESC